MSVEPRFSWPTRIYWEDTDAGGVVYHARYVAFMERARTEWMRALGYGQERMRAEHGMVFAVRSMQMDFIRPARLDDTLQVSARLVQLKKASMVFDQQILRVRAPTDRWPKEFMWIPGFLLFGLIVWMQRRRRQR